MPLDSGLADQRLAGMDDDARYGSVHLALSDGSLLPSGWAFAAVTAWLPGVRWVARLVGRVPRVGAVIDRVYHWVAPRRGVLARVVPDVAPVEHPGTPR